MEMSYHRRIKMREGWYEAGKLGLLIGPAVYVGGQHWSPVKWDDEEDPDMVKTAGIEFVSTLKVSDE